ncbi:MAG: alkaline phosphatase family protein [Verrucomicrobiota bacterium]
MSLASGVSPADHGLLSLIQPAPNAAAWQVASACHWSHPPVWQTAAAAGLSTAVIGWPGTTGTAQTAHTAAASDLELLVAAPNLSPLPPLPLDLDGDVVRVSPQEIDPGLLGFFIPTKALPADITKDPVTVGLLGYLARLYSVHNTTIARLLDFGPPDLLAVHYPAPDFSQAPRSLRPRLREAAIRLLDLLLGDLLKHAPSASLDLVGLATPSGFALSTNLPEHGRLIDLAPALLASLELKTGPASIIPPAAHSSAAGAELLRHAAASGLSVRVPIDKPPSERARQIYACARGELLLADGRPAEAWPLLAPTHFQQPENPRPALALFKCLQQLGLREDAAEIAQTLQDHAGQGPWSVRIQAELQLRLHGKPDKALQILGPLPASSSDPAIASLQRECRLFLGRFAEVKPLLEAAVADGTGGPDTHAALAYTHFRLGELKEARHFAKIAIAQNTQRPQPALILKQPDHRHTGPSAGQTALPSWDALFAAAERQTDARQAYATAKAGFMAGRAAQRERHAPVPFVPGTPAVPTDAVWTIVTGAARSGTALLLRMLAFGGHPVLTDGVRAPDEHNPCGYFEWSEVSRIATNPLHIDAAANHAIKVPLAILPSLPSDRRYRVLLVTRELDEIAASQCAVLRRPAPDRESINALGERIQKLITAVRANPAFDILEVPYGQLRAQPAEWATRLQNFLGVRQVRRPAAMAAAVRPELPRHRHA